MAIYHMQAKVVSRGSGRSAVAASAYMSCSRMYNDYDGIQHDYTRKHGLIYQEVMLPPIAPSKWIDREQDVYKRQILYFNSKNIVSFSQFQLNFPSIPFSSDFRMLISQQSSTTPVRPAESINTKKGGDKPCRTISVTQTCALIWTKNNSGEPGNIYRRWTGRIFNLTVR